MDRSLKVKRRVILGGLGILLAADLALGAYSWRESIVLRKPMKELQADSLKLHVLRADVDRADRIRHDLPATVAECDRFEVSLLPASSGNSAVTAELDELAKKSGLQIQSVSFKHKDLLGRNLTQVELEASVSGSYESIVKFMNGLQHSRNSYAVDSLAVQAEGQGGPNNLHVGLQMKTYVRTGA